MGRGQAAEDAVQPTGAQRRVPRPISPLERVEAEKLFSWQHHPSGTKVVLTGHYDRSMDGDDACESKGVLVRSGKEIGEWSRWMRHDFDGNLVFKNAWLKIPETADRYSGFGRAWTRELESRYRELGGHRVEILASLEGCVIWAKDSYRFHANWPYDPTRKAYPSTPLREAKIAATIWRAGGKKVEAFVSTGKVSAEVVAELEARFLPREDPLTFGRDDNDDPLEKGIIFTPAEIVTLGEEDAWEENGEKMWLGKALLDEHEWRGWKLL